MSEDLGYAAYRAALDATKVVPGTISPEAIPPEATVNDVKPTNPKDAIVGDIHSQARGTGARFNSGKPEYYQVPLFALEGVAKVLMYGAKKYAPGNWMKGQPWTVVYNSAMRHLSAWQRGEEIDSESELPHIDHALCNILFLSAYRDLYPEGDDRWKQMQKGGVPNGVDS